MSKVVFYFQVHQPFRLKRIAAGARHARPGDCFDDAENERILRRVAERCYLPMNAVLARAIDVTAGAFQCAFSISGTALDQLEAWAPAALESFQQLAATGHVEFLCETSHHSLAALADPNEFRAQVASHRDRIDGLFGQRPRVFRNTELIIDNEIATIVEELGFDGMLGEGADQLLEWRSPHWVYRPRGCDNLRLLLRDYRLSDDIAFRFSNREWPHYPLMADTFAGWLEGIPSSDPFVGLFMDYETFGEHQSKETGILEFMARLPGFVLESDCVGFATPSEVIAAHAASATFDIPEPMSWADAERDVSAWLGNLMQQEAQRELYGALDAVRDDPERLAAWRRLSTSDHVYYMCTKRRSDGDVHEYFTPYYSPQDSFVLFMRAVEDLTR